MHLAFGQVNTAFERANNGVNEDKSGWNLQRNWSGMTSPGMIAKSTPTAVSEEMLDSVIPYLSAVPDDFKLHRQLAKIHKDKATMLVWG